MHRPNDHDGELGPLHQHQRHGGAVADAARHIGMKKFTVFVEAAHDARALDGRERRESFASRRSSRSTGGRPNPTAT